MDEDELESELLTSSDEAEPDITEPYGYSDVEADQVIWQNLGER